MKVQVPFDQVIVFSTNLDPKDIVDEAFLRRIPYKIEAVDPTEAEFRAVLKVMAKKLELGYSESAVDYLIETYYKRTQRAYRFCHPRDLLLQVKNLCLYEGTEPELTRERIDFAVENYFAIM